MQANCRAKVSVSPYHGWRQGLRFGKPTSTKTKSARLFFDKARRLFR